MVKKRSNEHATTMGVWVSSSPVNPPPPPPDLDPLMEADEPLNLTSQDFMLFSQVTTTPKCFTNGKKEGRASGNYKNWVALLT